MKTSILNLAGVVMLFVTGITPLKGEAKPWAEEDSWVCLQQAMFFEARGEGSLGMLAVAEVTQNRVASTSFSNSYCEVIQKNGGKLHRCQYSFYCDGKPEIWDTSNNTEKASYNLSQRLSGLFLYEGLPFSITNGATHYVRCDVAHKLSWIKGLDFTVRIGHHCFYREKL